ncbi:hypothetical protein BF95_01300 [Sphingobium sp. Ant17]|nr:hypothetical protein BF95_01300 [Sphingobium sp. Ant17]
MIGILLTACIVLAAAQAMAVALSLLLLCVLIYSLFSAPRETLGFLALLFVAGLFQAQPLAFLCLVVLMVVAKIIQRR